MEAKSARCVWNNKDKKQKVAKRESILGVGMSDMQEGALQWSLEQDYLDAVSCYCHIYYFKLGLSID